MTHREVTAQEIRKALNYRKKHGKRLKVDPEEEQVKGFNACRRQILDAIEKERKP